MREQPNFEIQKISTEPISMRVISDIYMIYAYNKYIAVVDVYILKRKIQATLYASSTTVANFLEDRRIANNDTIIDIEFWIQKDGSSKFAKYILSEK